MKSSIRLHDHVRFKGGLTNVLNHDEYDQLLDGIVINFYHHATGQTRVVVVWNYINPNSTKLSHFVQTIDPSRLEVIDDPVSIV